MTIQREYTLPNFKLLVQGLAADPTETTGRPLLSVVTNVECRFVGHDATVVGGRSLLEALATAVSLYAQEILSGIPHPTPALPTEAAVKDVVQLERIKPDLHQLTVKTPEHPEPIQVALGTVELFDLVEAVDQLLSDAQTLPDLALSLSPVSRRYAQTKEPLAKRAVPAAVGLAGLAVAALALFFLPIPERREEPAAEPAAQEAPADPTAAASPPAEPTASPTPAATPAPESSPTPAAEATPEEPAEAAAEDAAEEAGEEPLNEAIANAPLITDPDQISTLQGQLRDELDGAWDNDPDFTEDLVYQVRVSQDGAILGFRYINDAAVENLDAVPLRDLQYNATDSVNQEPSAEYRVVFTADGVVQVSPWHGRPQ